MALGRWEGSVHWREYSATPPTRRRPNPSHRGEGIHIGPGPYGRGGGAGGLRIPRCLCGGLLVRSRGPPDDLGKKAGRAGKK